MSPSQIQLTALAEPQPLQAPTHPPTVGIFDSGIGGFTVAQSILKRRPDLSLVYFGDTLNMPYGGRAIEQLAAFARHSIEFLLEQGMEILAVGCNASNSALGQSELKSFGIPSYDLVSSTVQWLREQPALPERIALVASEATINSRYWQRKLAEAFPSVALTAAPAPEFVPLVEAFPQDPQAIREAVKARLSHALDAGIRAVLHGCTHYPLLETYITELAPDLSFIDPAECLAERLVAALAPAAPGWEPGQLNLFSSLPGEAFFAAGERVFGRSIRELTRMFIVNPHKD